MVLILVHSSTTCTLYTGILTEIKQGVCFVLLSVDLFLKFCSLSIIKMTLSLRYTLVKIFLAILSRRVKKALVNTDGQIDVASFVFNLYNSMGFYRYTFYIDIFFITMHFIMIIFEFFLKGGGGGLYYR